MNFVMMKSTTLRWIMLSITIIIALIIVSQLYWLKRVYTLEEQQFSTGVVKSIRGLFEDVKIADNPAFQVKQIVEVIDQNTYLVKLDSIPNKDSLYYHLSNEFEDFDVWTDCNVGVFSSRKSAFLYEFYLSTAASRYPQNGNVTLLPVNKTYDYLLLNFPHRNKYIIHEMLFWIVTAIVLLLVLIGLSVSLIYLYKQKFLNELQRDFVNNFTHEFKTPLAVMKIASDVLTQPSITTQPGRLLKYGTVIKEQTEHLQNQVERLLKTASGDNKDIIVNKEPCKLNEVIEHAIDQLEPLIKDKNADVHFTPNENDPLVMADKVHLQLVIINLIENALKYSDGAPYIAIDVQHEANNFYAVSVKDKGIGIEEKNFKYLFKKFYRVPTGNIHQVNGFGLGLNFVKKIVDAHDGKIVLKSVPGVGTEFKILLPEK
ncbi:MAG: integral rane sensor signal transduction histidine kinase [Ferruginibacter sp.]|uniref:sensor histidine kinase n=1 Tax=Ferruginibacter sp. TaxID=1940288 RepID=UPI00265983A6|nr:HAMP domain-containing sensor histidine kinase [Ferruginibacter sp.]MDB5276929.1 integral rane sensor signal transduction histidine kinase [Ferruginibacter sp.]